MTPLIDSPREHLQVLPSARRPRVAFYSQLVTFIHAPTALAFDQLVSTLDTLAVVLTIQHVAEPLIHVQSARLALAAILSRFERTGVLAVTSLDELTFRAAIPHIETALGRCRIDAFNLAHAIVKANAQALGASTVN